MRGIYIITSPSGKRYVGRTIDIDSRLSTHKCSAKASSYTCKAIASAIRKYGWNAMTVTRIPAAAGVDLCAVERFFVMLFQANDPHRGYNLTKGGDGSLGRPHTVDEIARISAAQRGSYPVKEIASAYSSGGLSVRKIAAQYKTSRSNVRRILARECVQLRRGDQRGLPSPYLRPEISDERKAAISRALKGKSWSAETNAKRSRTHKALGTKLSHDAAILGGRVAGQLNSHVRWHVNRGLVSGECALCQQQAS